MKYRTKFFVICYLYLASRMRMKVISLMHTILKLLLATRKSQKAMSQKAKILACLLSFLFKMRLRLKIKLLLKSLTLRLSTVSQIRKLTLWPLKTLVLAGRHWFSSLLFLQGNLAILSLYLMSKKISRLTLT